MWKQKNNTKMRFSIRYRVDGSGYFVGRKGTRAEGEIRQGGWLSGSSQYSEIVIIYDRAVTSTQNKKCYQLVPISKCSKHLIAAWEANSTVTPKICLVLLPWRIEWLCTPVIGLGVGCGVHADFAKKSSGLLMMKKIMSWRIMIFIIKHGTLSVRFAVKSTRLFLCSSSCFGIIDMTDPNLKLSISIIKGSSSTSPWFPVTQKKTI